MLHSLKEIVCLVSCLLRWEINKYNSFIDMWKTAFHLGESQADRSVGEKKPKLSGEDRPSITELSGYSFKREEFDVEYDNDAELVLADMEFRNTDTEAEHQMKLHVLHIYLKRYIRVPTVFCERRKLLTFMYKAKPYRFY